jgi:hypothetical protein
VERGESLLLAFHAFHTPPFPQLSFFTLLGIASVASRENFLSRDDLLWAVAARGVQFACLARLLWPAARLSPHTTTVFRDSEFPAARLPTRKPPPGSAPVHTRFRA